MIFPRPSSLMRIARVSTWFALVLFGATSHAQQVENGLLRVGSFRCASVKPQANDSSLDLYRTGYWNYTGFRMEVWRRLGIPFWYRKGTGVIRVAGEGWQPELGDDISSAQAGGKATEATEGPSIHKEGPDPHVEEERGPINAIDHDKSTAWEPPDESHHGKLIVTFAALARVQQIRFLSDSGPRYTPRDYSIGLVLPDGSSQEIVSIAGESSVGGTWREFLASGVEAKGMYIDVRSSGDGKHPAMIAEFEAHGEFLSEPKLATYPAQAVIPMNGATGKALHFIGNVGSGFPVDPDVETPVGEYVIRYANGQSETVPLIAGKNVADIRYGHFVPDALFAYGLKPHDPPAGGTAYHLDQQLPVEINDQLMIFSHVLEHAEWPIQSVEFRCTRPKTSLVLAAITVDQAGARINPLFYNGKMVRPYPDDAPPASPRILDGLKDPSREVSLDGTWNYQTDPGNAGIRKQFFSPSYDASSWKTMTVPSQWFVQGLDYHGVVWFRRELQVPGSFPGSVAELQFGAVSYEASVWVNGVFVGTHIGPYTSFKLDVTSALKKGAANLIVVRVDCPLDPGYETYKTLVEGNTMDDISMPYGREGSVGGIYRSVELRARGDSGIEELWATTDVSQDLKRADVLVKLTLKSASPTGKAEVRATLTEPDHPGASPRTFNAAKQVKVDSAQVSVELPLQIDDPLLWYPWEQGTPYLHVLKVEVLRNGEVSDTRFIRVGIRQIEFNEQDHYVLVNHHRIFLKGILNDDIHWRSLMDRRGYAQRVKMQKDANINIIRMIAHQSGDEMYDLCDEMGMMIWQEMPLQWEYSRSNQIREEILGVVHDTLIQTRPHASIVGWSAWNEGGQPYFSDRITAVIRALDGTRPLTRASGHGEFDVHIYPNMTDGLQRRTSLWTGLKLNFVSETGSYGLSSEQAIREMAGDNFLQFDSVNPIWDNFDSYRWVDDPVFPDSPKAASWTTEKIRQYVLAKIKPSERFYAQYHKFQYENARAQRFDPTTALIHCRFDDAYPLAYSGAPVNFNGMPKPAYFAIQNANRAVLPILFFDFEGAKDIRVVNDYWWRGWKGAKLTYRLRTRDGKTVSDLTRIFDLPPDSTVPVIEREDTGDVWHVPGGFFADLTVFDPDGKVLSENHYDFTDEEVQAFLTSVYPLAPVKPANSVVLTADEASAMTNVEKQPSEGGTYSHQLLKTSPGGAKPAFEFTATVPEDSDYYVRVSANNAKAAHKLHLTIDGKEAPLEKYDTLDANEHLTRDVYATPDISWYPGWTTHLKKGQHHLVFSVPAEGATPDLLFDAIALQSYRNLPNPFLIPGIRDLKAEAEVGP
ncbi:MAG TPA: glycoside hydrolase family 2 TIM barrel-domain containing protein [Candidatus Sulfotelmatobacter sp.]|nr:glycoside hydrolase family 2 TIM barrel-domain containing protein [Candidatus Sulfotelmatobacter sp.]